MIPPLPPNEAQRLAALRELNILDTLPEERFDRITRLAQRIFNIPITLISLVDAHRQWFKSRQGLSVQETPRDISFCTHAILQPDIMVVPDAVSDPRFANSPLVTGAPGIRFYAGRPLAARDGSRVGMLCLIDRHPRQLTKTEVSIFEELGAMAEDELNFLSTLQESEQRFKTIFEQSPVGMNLVDLHDWRFVEVNSTFCQLLGYTHEECERLTARDVMPPEDLEANVGEIQAMLEGRRPSCQAEIRNKRKDGKLIWVRVFVTLLRTIDGKPRYFLAIEEDITERKRLEAAMIKSEKLAATGQFAAGVAHDVNNPIGVILGFVQGLIRRLPESDPLMMPYKSIEREALRCKTLVQNLLAFSRGQGNTAVMKPEDLNQVIENALVLVATLARPKKVNLVSLPRQELPPVSIDSNQIQQVVINLCTNAIDAMPNGGTLTVGAANKGDHAEISVRDTGSGIPPEIRDRIFEAFFTTKEVGKGTGLGLSIISAIVKTHHGKIDVQSAVGKGTNFIVQLPLPTQAVCKIPPLAA